MQGPLCAGPFLQVARDRRHRGQMFYWRAVTVSVLPMRLGAHGYWGPRSNHAPMVSRSSPTPAGTTILRHRCIPCDRVPAARLPSLALGSLVGLDTTRGPGEQVHTGGGGGGMGGGFVWSGADSVGRCRRHAAPEVISLAPPGNARPGRHRTPLASPAVAGRRAGRDVMVAWLASRRVFTQCHSSLATRPTRRSHRGGLRRAWPSSSGWAGGSDSRRGGSASSDARRLVSDMPRRPAT